MINRACNCCTQPTGSSPLLEWDSVSASKTWDQGCAFASFDNDGRFWLKSTHVVSRNSSGSYHCAWESEDGFGGGSYSIEYSESDNPTKVTICNPETGERTCSASGSYSASCEVRSQYESEPPEVLTQSASGSYSDCAQGFNDFELTGDFFYFNVQWGNEADCPASWRGDGGYSLDFVSSTVMSLTLTESCGPKAQDACSAGGSRRSSFSRSESITLSDETKPEDMLQKAIDSLDEFDDDWDDSSGSYKDVTDWTASVRKSRWRIVHAPTGTCFFRVWLRSVFTPKDGSDPIIEEIAPYTWEGSGTPCYQHDDLPPHDLSNRIFSPPHDLEIPDEEGTIRVEVVKWSCLPSYTPEEGEPNGFPAEE